MTTESTTTVISKVKTKDGVAVITVHTTPYTS